MDAYNRRKQLSVQALNDMFEFLDEDGQVAIFDATNSTRERRQMIRDMCRGRQINPIFVESICNDDMVCELYPVVNKMRCMFECDC